MFCGIVGFTGSNNYQSAPVLLKGLQKLEYRGYDSAGLYVSDETTGPQRMLKDLQELRTHVGQLMVCHQLTMRIHISRVMAVFTWYIMV
jgi:glucosamine 6-phosphate synthetase-like amidotransferase/phosphosugar isomerase protein